MTLCPKTTDLFLCSRFITGLLKNLCTQELPSLSKIATFSMISNTVFAVSTVSYLTYGICGWGNCALTFQRKIVTLQKRALRLIYFSKSKEHAVPFFLKSNCLPIPSLFFRDCGYLLYDINRQTATVSILNKFFKTSQIHNYRTRSNTRSI